MTSAVRDAANGAEFAAPRGATRLGSRAHADRRRGGALTFAGAIARATEEDDAGPGDRHRRRSTELVIGVGGEVTFHVSTQVGVVRHAERHLHSDPPHRRAGRAARATCAASSRSAPRACAKRSPSPGTPTQCAAIDLALEQYDPARVEGHNLTRERLASCCDALRAPASRAPASSRARSRPRPVIVAGIAILLEVLRRFGLQQVEVSEHDILFGLALSTLPTPESSPECPSMDMCSIASATSRWRISCRKGGRASRRRPRHIGPAMPHHRRLPPSGPPNRPHQGTYPCPS